MKVYYNLDEITPIPNAVLSIGTFDGLHLGHQKILENLKEIAQKRNGESVLLTFFPHPRMVIFDDSQQLKMLNTIDEKIELLTNFGIDHLVIIPFTRQFSEMDSDTFIQKVLVDKIGARTLVLGYDHRFGKDRKGSFEYLKNNIEKFPFELIEISRQDLENVGISSSKVRNALADGNVEYANKLLNSKFSIKGKVVKGKQIGRTIGYPTANVQVPEDYKLIPGNGVYAVQIQYLETIYNGVLNIGVRPTVDGKTKTIEAHIFSFDKEIYGEELKVFFVAKIRNEQKFVDLEALKIQIEIDSQKALAILTT